MIFLRYAFYVDFLNLSEWIMSSPPSGPLFTNKRFKRFISYGCGIAFIRVLFGGKLLLGVGYLLQNNLSKT